MFKTHIICYSVYTVLSLFGYTFPWPILKKKRRGEERRGKGQNRSGGGEQTGKDEY